MSNSNSLSEYLVLSCGRWNRDVSREDIHKKGVRDNDYQCDRLNDHRYVQIVAVQIALGTVLHDHVLSLALGA
ncbi:hypothetical protein EJMOOK_12035 [Rhodanobacter sp. Root179]|nr:hypothetical protein ASD82_10485 [Rhodanobacter sp. Root179]